MIIISLDYDATFTIVPDMWLAFIKNAPAHVKIYCVTMRYPEEGHDIDPRLTDLVEVIFTSRQAKRKYMENLGIHVNIWIDDMPDFVVSNSF